MQISQDDILIDHILNYEGSEYSGDEDIYSEE
jgi:hypothetical protein